MWANRIHDRGAERVWAYFNNDRNTYAIRNARALWRLLQKQESQDLIIPRPRFRVWTWTDTVGRVVLKACPGH